MVRQMDIFGEPISLYYKGETTFNTRVGGICSMVLLSLILTNLGTDLYKFSKGSQFAQIYSYDFVPIGSFKKDTWNLKTSEYTMAGLLEPVFANKTDYDPETIARVQFYIWTLPRA